ncbi:MAG: hypothetical protein AAF211_23340 [Myxococcota bacterium]
MTERYRASGQLVEILAGHVGHVVTGQLLYASRPGPQSPVRAFVDDALDAFGSAGLAPPVPRPLPEPD